MKHRSLVSCALLAGVVFAGCGSGPDRVALARQTIQTYWTDINTGKWTEAYNMITPGERATITLASYEKNWIEFLTRQAASITVVVGAVHVKGDCADARITLKSPRSVGHDQAARQHLFWNDGKWQIADQNGAAANVSSAGCV